MRGWISRSGKAVDIRYYAGLNQVVCNYVSEKDGEEKDVEVFACQVPRLLLSMRVPISEIERTLLEAQEIDGYPETRDDMIPAGSPERQMDIENENGEQEDTEVGEDRVNAPEGGDGASEVDSVNGHDMAEGVGSPEAGKDFI